MLTWNAIRKKITKLAHEMRSARFKKLLSLQLELRPYLQGVPYWSAAFLVGVLAVVYSGAFTLCIHLSQWILGHHPYLFFVTSPICFLLSVWLVETFAPMAGGTGVPQVARALDLDTNTQFEEIDRYLNLRVAVVVGLSSLLATLGAGALGREGPMVHMAACLFYFVGRQLNRFWPYIEHHSWIVAGGAAGVASAFNAPLAGVVFALEELAIKQFHKFKSYVISAAIIGGIVAQWISGRYLYLGYPKIETVPLSAVFWAILVGLMCGTLAYPFQWLLTIRWREKVPYYFRTRLAFAFLVGILMASLATFVHKGTIGGGIREITDLLFIEDNTADWKLLFGRFFGTIISHLSGCAGGFLAPSLALGALIGSKISVITHYPSHNLMVLVGMAAFLSAIIRAPFTAWVVVMEMTDRHSAIFPLMVASLVSFGTLRFFIDKEYKRMASFSP